MGLKISGHVISNVGVKKYVNEDNYLINGSMNECSKPISETQWNQNSRNKSFSYAAVFDGMGGGEGGQQASLIAAQELQKMLDMVSVGMNKKEIERLANQGILNANRRIVEERKKHSILGTTATVLCIQGDQAKLFHLGDSRAYLFRDNKLIQLTKDQTLAELKISAGIYNADHPEVERDKNMLTEYVGADETMTSLKSWESDWISLNPTDKLLLCSDGLHHLCVEEELKDVLQLKKEPGELADLLVYSALKRGGTDNITCLTLALQAEE